MGKLRDIIYVDSDVTVEVKSMEVTLTSLKDILSEFDDLYKTRQFIYFNLGKKREDCLLEVINLINQVDVMFRHKIDKNIVYAFKSYKNSRVCYVSFEECYSFMLREMAEWLNDLSNNVGAFYIIEEKLFDYSVVRNFLVTVKDFAEWRAKHSKDDSVDTTLKRYYGIIDKGNSVISKLLSATDNMNK